MNKIITSLLFLFGWIFISQAQETVNLSIEIEVTEYNKGTIFFALYNSEYTYMKKVFKGKEALVKDNKAKIIFKDLKKGIYAFSLFHDLNKNGKLDKNFIGIPKEPYVFSNNEKGSFGPPKFDDVTFEVSENKTVKVSIK